MSNRTRKLRERDRLAKREAKRTKRNGEPQPGRRADLLRSKPDGERNPSTGAA
jgi:hypothetical protein